MAKSKAQKEAEAKAKAQAVATPESIEVTQEILDLNPSLIEGGVSVGDEIEVTSELVLEATEEVAEVKEAEEEAPKQSGKKNGVKYAVYIERGEGKREYIRTYEDEALAKEFAGKVAQRVVVEE